MKIPQYDKEKELGELLKQLNIDDRKAEKIADEIRAADELLHRQNEPVLPAAVVARIEQAIKCNLPARKASKAKYRLKRLAPVAAAILIGLLAVSYSRLARQLPSEAHRALTMAQNENDLFDDDLDL